MPACIYRSCFYESKPQSPSTCIPILVTTFPERLSGTEPLPHTPARCVHLRCACSVLHMFSFAGLIRRTPPPTFSDTAITDRHSDTTIYQLRAHWLRIPWSVGSEKSFGHVPRWESNPRLPARQAPYPRGQAFRTNAPSTR